MYTDIGKKLVEAAINDEGAPDEKGYHDHPIAHQLREKIGDHTRHTIEGLTIVAGGGGMRCAHTAGRLLSLLCQQILPEEIIAVSGSTGPTSYLLANQPYSLIHIWAHQLSTQSFINSAKLLHIPFRVKDILDGKEMPEELKALSINYLIDRIFREQEPLDTHAVMQSPILYSIAAHNCTTGKVEYFDSKARADSGIIIRGGDELLEAKRATKSVPLADGQKVLFQNSSRYCDSPNSASSELHIRRAVQNGAKKVLVIEHKKSLIQDSIYYGHLTIQNDPTLQQALDQHDMRNTIRSEIRQTGMYEGVPVLILRPRSIRGGLLTNKKEIIHQNIQDGYDETTDNQELLDFLAL